MALHYFSSPVEPEILTYSMRCVFFKSNVSSTVLKLRGQYFVFEKRFRISCYLAVRYLYHYRHYTMLSSWNIVWIRAYNSRVIVTWVTEDKACCFRQGATLAGSWKPMLSPATCSSVTYVILMNTVAFGGKFPILTVETS